MLGMMEENQKTKQARKDLKQAALLDSLIHVSVLGPTALGGTALAAGFALASSNPLIWMSGLCGLALGAIAAGWRLLRRYPRVIAEAFKTYDETQAIEQAQVEEEALDHLSRRLHADDNPLTQQLLADLRQCAQQQRALNARPNQDHLHESINQDLKQLISGSLYALKHLADLWDSMNKLQLASHIQQMASERAAIIAELQENLPLISKQLRDLERRNKPDQPSADVTKVTSAEDLARLRSQLSANIAVAERVEERLKQLDHDIELPPKQ